MDKKVKKYYIVSHYAQLYAQHTTHNLHIPINLYKMLNITLMNSYEFRTDTISNNLNNQGNTTTQTSNVKLSIQTWNSDQKKSESVMYQPL